MEKECMRFRVEAVSGEEWSKLGKYNMEMPARHLYSNVQEKVETFSCWSDSSALPFIMNTNC